MIKFRVRDADGIVGYEQCKSPGDWQFKTAEMVDLLDADGVAIYDWLAGTFPGPGPYIREQWTTCKDDDGVEVYQGDKLECSYDWDDEKYITVVDDELAVEVYGCDFTKTLLQWADSIDEFKVIGSIHDKEDGNV